jgi:hypothetical protein
MSKIQDILPRQIWVSTLKLIGEWLAFAFRRICVVLYIKASIASGI